MPISTELEKLRTNLEDIYDACEEKGATMPTNKNFDSVAETISTITGGGASGLLPAQAIGVSTFDMASSNQFLVRYTLPSDATSANILIKASSMPQSVDDYDMIETVTTSGSKTITITDEQLANKYYVWVVTVNSNGTQTAQNSDNTSVHYVKNIGEFGYIEGYLALGASSAVYMYDVGDYIFVTPQSTSSNIKSFGVINKVTNTIKNVATSNSTPVYIYNNYEYDDGIVLCTNNGVYYYDKANETMIVSTALAYNEIIELDGYLLLGNKRDTYRNYDATTPILKFDKTSKTFSTFLSNNWRLEKTSLGIFAIANAGIKYFNGNEFQDCLYASYNQSSGTWNTPTTKTISNVPIWSERTLVTSDGYTYAGNGIFYELLPTVYNSKGDKIIWTSSCNFMRLDNRVYGWKGTAEYFGSTGCNLYEITADPNVIIHRKTVTTTPNFMMEYPQLGGVFRTSRTVSNVNYYTIWAVKNGVFTILTPEDITSYTGIFPNTSIQNWYQALETVETENGGYYGKGCVINSELLRCDQIQGAILENGVVFSGNNASVSSLSYGTGISIFEGNTRKDILSFGINITSYDVIYHNGLYYLHVCGKNKYCLYSYNIETEELTLVKQLDREVYLIGHDMVYDKTTGEVLSVRHGTAYSYALSTNYSTDALKAKGMEQSVFGSTPIAYAGYITSSTTVLSKILYEKVTRG